MGALLDSLFELDYIVILFDWDTRESVHGHRDNIGHVGVVGSHDIYCVDVDEGNILVETAWCLFASCLKARESSCLLYMASDRSAATGKH